MSDELVLEQRTIIDFYDVASRMGRSVADVFTGQSVLERGSANSDVLGRYHASRCTQGGV